MKLRFTRWRTLPAKENPLSKSASRKTEKGQAVLGIGDLSDVDRCQLVACAGRGATLQFTVEELFSDGFAAGGGDRTWIVESTQVPFEWWDLLCEKGVARFQAWFYQADSALVFAAGTTTVVAQGIQYGSAWEIEGNGKINYDTPHEGTYIS